MQKTNIAYEQSARAMRAYRAEVDRYKRVGQEGSTRGIAAAAKEEAEAMRLAQLETKGAAQAQRCASLEEQQRVQSQIASAAASRAEQAQQAALAAANQEAAQAGTQAANAANAQAAAARSTEESTRAAAAATREMNAEMRSARQGPGIFSSIGRALRSMLLIRSVTSMARHFVRWLGQAAMANREFNAAVQGIRGNLISAFAPIYEAIIPWLTQLANAIATVVGWISRLSSFIFGSASSNTAKMLSGIGGAAGGASKQMKQLLANFDELNVLERSNGGSGGGGGGGSGSGGGGGIGGNAINNFMNNQITGADRIDTALGVAGAAAGLAAGKWVWNGLKGLIGLGAGNGGIAGLFTIIKGFGIGAAAIETALATITTMRSGGWQEEKAETYKAFQEGKYGEWVGRVLLQDLKGVVASVAQIGVDAWSKITGNDVLNGVPVFNFMHDPGKAAVEAFGAENVQETMQRWMGFLQNLGKINLGDALSSAGQRIMDALKSAINSPAADWLGTNIGEPIMEAARKAGGWLWGRLTGAQGAQNGNALTAGRKKDNYIMPGERTAKNFEKAFELWDKGAGQANRLNREISSLRVGAGEVAQSIGETASTVLPEAGRQFEELDITAGGVFADINDVLEDTNLALSLGAQNAEAMGDAVDSIRAQFNAIGEAARKAKEAIVEFWERIDRNGDKQDEQRAGVTGDTNRLNPNLYLDTKGQTNKVAVNMFDRNDKGAVSESTLPSHGSVNGPATYQGTQATAQDVAAAVTSALKGVKIELDGRALGQVVQGAINTAVRGAGRSDLVTLY